MHNHNGDPLLVLCDLRFKYRIQHKPDHNQCGRSTLTLVAKAADTSHGSQDRPKRDSISTLVPKAAAGSRRPGCNEVRSTSSLNRPLMGEKPGSTSAELNVQTGPPRSFAQSINQGLTSVYFNVHLVPNLGRSEIAHAGLK